MILSKVDRAFIVIAFGIFCVHIYASNFLGIGYGEVTNYFEKKTIVAWLSYFSCSLFGNSNIAFRLPFVIISLLNIILMYLISKDYFSYEKDRLYNILVFSLLPGVIGASLLANEAVIVIFWTLLYVFWFKKYQKHSHFFLICAVFLDNSFLILFFALMIYAFVAADKKLFIINLICFLAVLFLFGLDETGKPKGYFVDTLIIFGLIFSPALFFYFFYSLYTVPLRKEQNLLWYISFSALVVALVISLRQKIAIEDFAPFIVIATPFMMKLFLNSMRIRLIEFRFKYYLGSFIALFILGINSFLLLYRTPLYLIVNDPKEHFGFEYDFVTQIAATLHEHNIHYVIADNPKLQKQLEFYGIHRGGRYKLDSFAKGKDLQIRFSYCKKNIYNVGVTKINI